MDGCGDLFRGLGEAERTTHPMELTKCKSEVPFLFLAGLGDAMVSTEALELPGLLGVKFVPVPISVADQG